MNDRHAHLSIHPLHLYAITISDSGHVAQDPGYGCDLHDARCKLSPIDATCTFFAPNSQGSLTLFRQNQFPVDSGVAYCIIVPLLLQLDEFT